MNLHKCKHCGETPAIIPLDVADSISIYHAYHVCKANGKEIKIATGWRFSREAVVSDWNTNYGTETQPSKATSALLRMKAVLGNA